MVREASLCAVFSLVSAAAGQSVLVVGPGGFGSIDAAWAAARDGDTILVRQDDPIVGPLGGKSVKIAGDGARRDLMRLRIAAHHFPHTLVIENLRITYGAWIAEDHGIEVVASTGHLLFHDVVVQQDDPSRGLGKTAVELTDAANVAFVGCLLDGDSGVYLGSTPCSSAYADGGHGVCAVRSGVSFSNTVVRGDDGPAPPLTCGVPWRRGGDGIRADHAALSIAGSMVTGGRGGNASLDGAALRLTATRASVSPGTAVVSTDAATTVYAYGGAPVMHGPGSLVADPAPLPAHGASLSGNVLTLVAASGPPHGAVLGVVALRPWLVPAEPLARGALTVRLDPIDSLVIWAGALDARGAGNVALAIPAGTIAAYPYRSFLTQLVTVAPGGGPVSLSAAASFSF